MEMLKEQLEPFLKGVSKMKYVCIFKDVCPLKHAEDLKGRSRQIIFLLSLAVKQAGCLALLMQCLVKLSGNAT